VPFNLELCSAESARAAIVGDNAYAIFFKNTTYNEHQRKLVSKEGSTGVDIKRITGAYTTVAKPLSRSDIAKAETGKLFS
jgi:hypothetical protein